MKAFSLASAGHLPLTGDLHPLRREATRWLTSANGLVLALGIAIFGTWYVWSHAQHVDEVPAGVTIVWSAVRRIVTMLPWPGLPNLNTSFSASIVASK